MEFFKSVSQALNPSGSDSAAEMQPPTPAPAAPAAPGAGSSLYEALKGMLPAPSPAPQISGDNYGGFFQAMQKK